MIGLNMGVALAIDFGIVMLTAGFGDAKVGVQHIIVKD